MMSLSKGVPGMSRGRRRDQRTGRPAEKCLTALTKREWWSSAWRSTSQHAACQIRRMERCLSANCRAIDALDEAEFRTSLRKMWDTVWYGLSALRQFPFNVLRFACIVGGYLIRPTSPNLGEKSAAPAAYARASLAVTRR
jgi:hypothetical protein